MDPATIAALAGAPASVVLVYLVIYILKDHRSERRDFLAAMAAERKVIERFSVTIQRQSALLLVVAEQVAPGRSAAIQRQVEKLFQVAPVVAEGVMDSGSDESA